ncbi:MAG: response regulator transcription factor [Chloroflexi bacterium]|nr:response regulator transcription factor [Chloroflexota bacterium]
MGDRITVLLVDDHEMARRGLRRVLELEEGIEVVAEASNAKQALLLAEHHSPDVIFMDIRMGEMSGIEATRQINGMGLTSKVILLSIYNSYLQQAIEAGAAGYLGKDAKASELVSALRWVLQGGFVFGASIIDTAEGREIAFRYLTGGGAVTTGEASAGEASASETGPASSPSVSDILVSDAALVISPPSQPAKLLELHRWLTEFAKAEIGETIGTRGEDFVMQVAFPQPIPLLRMLAELPYVAGVTEEPYRRESGTTPRPVGGALGVGHMVPKRIRVILKPDETGNR